MVKITSFITDTARFLVDPTNQKHRYPSIACALTIILGTLTLGIPQILSQAWRHFQPEERNETHEKIKKIFNNLFKIDEKNKEKADDTTPKPQPLIPRKKTPKDHTNTTRKSRSAEPLKLNPTPLDTTKKLPTTEEVKEPPKALDLDPPKIPLLSDLLEDLKQIFANANTYDHACSLGKALQEPLEKTILQYVDATLHLPETNILEIVTESLKVIDKQSASNAIKKKGGKGGIRHWIACSESSLLKAIIKKYLDQTLNEEPLLGIPLESENFKKINELVLAFKRNDQNGNTFSLLQEPISLYIANLKKEIEQLPLSSKLPVASKTLEKSREKWERLILTILSDEVLVQSSKDLLQEVVQQLSERLIDFTRTMQRDFLKNEVKEESNQVYAQLNGLLLVLNTYHLPLGLRNPLEEVGKIMNGWGISADIFKNILALEALNPSKRAVAEAMGILFEWIGIHQTKDPTILGFLDSLDAFLEKIQPYNVLKLEDRDVLMACYMVNLRIAIREAVKIVQPLFDRVSLDLSREEDREISKRMQETNKKLKEQLNLGLKLKVSMHKEADGLLSLLIAVCGFNHIGEINDWLEMRKAQGNARLDGFKLWIRGRIAAGWAPAEDEVINWEDLYQTFLRGQR